MALTMAMKMSLFLNILLSLSLHPWTSSGFTLKLVHRDSPNSPLYQSNLSGFDRFMKNVESSKSRASYFDLKLVKTPSIRLPLNFRDAATFTVDIGLGTPVVNRTLIFDTGSSLTWTQCKPCLLCYKQNQPLFDPKHSSSYKKLTEAHKLSKGFTCSRSGCFYTIGYYSKQYTKGTLAIENFSFRTSAGRSHTVPGLVFGCGMNNRGHFPKEINGILGMGKEPESFARQLETLIEGRFSYCLNLNSNTSNAKESYVTFGSEATIQGKNAQRTPLLVNNLGDRFYTTNLKDISIGGQKLGLTSATFPGGCIIDSGSSISLLNDRAFSATANFLTTYFSKFNVTKYVGKSVPKGFVCYKQPGRLVKLPSLTFHFAGADFQVPPENLFISFKTRFLKRKILCLAMMGSPNTTILGAFQQANVKMVYDLKQEMLSFAPEDCSKDNSLLS